MEDHFGDLKAAYQPLNLLTGTNYGYRICAAKINCLNVNDL